MVKNCDSFYKVKAKDTCAKIASAKGVTKAQLIKWNPALGKDCTGIWVDYVSGHLPFSTCEHIFLSQRSGHNRRLTLINSKYALVLWVTLLRNLRLQKVMVSLLRHLIRKT